MRARWSIARVLKPVGARSKYRAIRTEVHGRSFDSKAEARRYQELLLRGMAGEIRNLELQPRFPITVNGVRIADYVADFRYEQQLKAIEFRADGSRVVVNEHNEWADVVEDVKGVKTPLYRLKKKLVEQLYGIQIQEVR